MYICVRGRGQLIAAVLRRRMVGLAPTRLHASGAPPRRGSGNHLLAPLSHTGENAEKKEWSVADRRRVDAEVAQMEKRMSDIQEKRLARAIRLMRNVPLLSAFNTWWEWVDASFEARGARRLQVDETARSLAAFRERRAAAATAASQPPPSVAQARPAGAAESVELVQVQRVEPAPASRAIPEPEPEPEPHPQPQPQTELLPHVDLHRESNSKADDTEKMLAAHGEAVALGSPPQERSSSSPPLTPHDTPPDTPRASSPGRRPPQTPPGTPRDLRAAAKRGDLDKVKLLIDGGVDVNAEDIAQPLSSRTALHTAAGQGHVDVVMTLIDAGARVVIADAEGNRYPVRERIDNAKANYKASVVVAARAELQALEEQRALREASLEEMKVKWEQVKTDRAIIEKEYKKLASDPVARKHMQKRVLELQKELHTYDNTVSGLIVKTKQKLELCTEKLEEVEAVLPSARHKLESAEHEWCNWFPPVRAVYPLSQQRSEHEYRVIRKEKLLRELQSYRGFTEQQLAQQLHEFDRWPVFKEVELRTRYPGLTELQLETCLRVSATAEWVPLGGKGSVHPGVPLQSETERALESAGNPFLTAAARRLALGKMLHVRLGCRSPWPGLLQQISERTGRNHLQELCESWILWAWSGDLIVVAGGFTTITPVEDDGTLGRPSTLALPTVSALLKWPSEGAVEPSLVEARLRSGKLSCQQEMVSAVAAAAELVEYALPWTPEQKERQRILQERAEQFFEWTKDHTAMATLWRYFYELPKEESGIVILSEMIEDSFVPWSPESSKKRKVNAQSRETGNQMAKKKEKLDLVEEFLDLLLVLHANAVDGGWQPPPPRWRPLPPMTTARCNFSMVTLSGGGVFVAGGWDGPKSGWDEGGHVFASAEVLMPGEQGWRRVADMPTPRHGCTGTVLQNGKVMVVGGSDDLLGPMRTVEVWDPSDGCWEKSTSTFGEHANAGVCTLPDGRVLVCGGFGGGRSTEVYDFRTESWSLLADMQHPSSGGRFGCSVVPLNAGTVMVMGGKGLRSCEALDTIDNSAEYEAAKQQARKKREAVKNALVAESEASKLVKEAVDQMPQLREAENRAKMTYTRAVDTNAPDHRELGDKAAAAREARKQGQEHLDLAKVALAECVDARETAELTAKRYEADAEAMKKVWAALADLGVSRFEAAYCKIPDGRVIAIGGENNHCQMQDTCEIYDPGPNTWRPLPEGQLLMPLTDHRACLIPSGFSGGHYVRPDVDQQAHAHEHPSAQQFAFTKAQRLVAKHTAELTEDEKTRDAKPWTEEEEERLVQLVKMHPFGSDAEWRAIATDLGTARSFEAVKLHFNSMEEEASGAGKRLRSGLDGRGHLKAAQGKRKGVGTGKKGSRKTAKGKR